MSSAASPPDPAIVPLTRAGRIDADVMCFGCQYNLRTQPPDGRCPECGHSIADSLTSDNAILMPPFWLGQVYRGSVCLAVAWPTIPLCGLGLIIGLVGILSICNDPPLAQFRVRNLQRLTLGSLLACGVLFLTSLLAAEAPLMWALTLSASFIAGATGVAALHLFARRTAQAARLPGFSWPAMALAVITPALALWVVALMLVAAAQVPLHFTYFGSSTMVDLVEFLWVPTILMGLAYVLMEIAFWGAFARMMKRVRDQALATAQQRGAAGV